jgi:hypothetical protein
LDLFHFFVAGTVFKVSDFFFEVELVADEDVVELFDFERKILK